MNEKTKNALLSIVASLVCIVIGLLVGFIILYCINAEDVYKRQNFMEQNMFCYQCQETAGCSGCTKSGVCGKRPETAALQDLLIWTTKGLSAVTTQLRREGKTVDASVNHLITENLFTTITNVNLSLIHISQNTGFPL